MATLKRKRPKTVEPTPTMRQRDQAIADRMAQSDEPMPLEYMEENMHWYAQQALVYEQKAKDAPHPNRFRTKRQKQDALNNIKHYESMAIKFRALNQAAAETAANYLHARIQSVSIGNSRGSKSLTIVLSGADARL